MKLVKYFNFILLAILILGCSSSSKSIIQQIEPDLTPKISSIKLEAGDEIEIKFYRVPELNERQRIRPDGKINLQIVGDIFIAGSTPEEIREKLIKLYEKDLTNPEITIIVRELLARKVYVGGEVNNPKAVSMPGSLTALEAIILAGGFKNLTAAKTIVLIRHKNGKRYGHKIKIKPTLNGKEVVAFYLEPRDIVYVPKTNITKITQWIDQYINKIIPRVPFVFSLNYNETFDLVK